MFSVKDDFQGLLAIHHNQKYGSKYINYSLLYSNAQVPPLEMDLVVLQVCLESWWGLVWQGALLLFSTKEKRVAKLSWEMLVWSLFSPQATLCFTLPSILNNLVRFHLKIRMEKNQSWAAALPSTWELGKAKL